MTLKEKIAIAYCLYGTTTYADSFGDEIFNNNPAWEKLDVWLSEIIGVDFRELYNNPETYKNSNFTKEVMRQYVVDKYYSWYLPDSLRQCLYQQIMDLFIKQRGMDENEIAIETIESKVKYIWNTYNKLLNLTKQDDVGDKASETPPPLVFEYEVVGTLNGEELYRKIIKNQ